MWLLCDDGTVLKTPLDDGTWMGVRRGGRGQSRAIAVAESGKIVLGGASGIEWSDDNGSTWHAAKTPDSISVNTLVASGSSLWAAGKSGTILSSTDGGKTWKPQATYTTSSIEGLCFLDEKRGWAVGWLGTILRTRDGGGRWESVPAGVTDTLLAVSFLDAENGWIVGAPGVILRTKDGGTTWAELPAPIPGWFRSVVVTPAGRGWISGDSNILGTRDGGATWQPVDPPGSMTSAMNRLLWHGGHLWVAGPNGTWRLEGDRQWQEIGDGEVQWESSPSEPSIRPPT